MRDNKLQKKFTKIYEDLSDAIFRHCYFRLSDRERALDLMQETFLRTWNVIAEGKEPVRNPKALLYRVANNLIIDEYRTRKTTVSIEGLKESGWEMKSSSAEESRVDVVIELERTMKVLDKMDEKYKNAVVMKYVDELSLKEIAEAMGESVSNAGVRVSRGLKQLKQLLENEK
jgi:RNA polymerase sigma-70 factor (ECF subfamily)